jgi:hypothetical protein
MRRWAGAAPAAVAVVAVLVTACGGCADSGSPEPPKATVKGSHSPLVTVRVAEIRADLRYASSDTVGNTEEPTEPSDCSVRRFVYTKQAPTHQEVLTVVDRLKSRGWSIGTEDLADLSDYGDFVEVEKEGWPAEVGGGRVPAKDEERLRPYKGALAFQAMDFRCS